jgi:hypothetical protein
MTVLCIQELVCNKINILSIKKENKTAALE